MGMISTSHLKVSRVGFLPAIYITPMQRNDAGMLRAVQSGGEGDAAGWVGWCRSELT